MTHTWFHNLFGFHEACTVGKSNLGTFLKTQEQFAIGKGVLTSKVNQRTFQIGEFSTPSLGTLRNSAANLLRNRKIERNTYQRCNTAFNAPKDNFQIYHNVLVEHRIIGDALSIHNENPGSTIQAASQFNCLEFPNSSCFPEQGITNYYSDRTQGPACALACAAGTLYRNYFVPLNENGDLCAEDNDSTAAFIGQRADRQLNTLRGLERLLNNEENKFFKIENGYAHASEYSLQRFNQYMETSDIDRNAWLDSVMIGLHKNVGVTFADNRYQELKMEKENVVTQCYSSAMSCSYSGVQNKFWAHLASLVLEATYEATLWAAVCNWLSQEETSSGTPPSSGGSSSTDQALPYSLSQTVFLTFVGGGVFGNENAWIANAIGKGIANLASTKGVELHVIICHYRTINKEMQELINQSITDHMASISVANVIDYASERAT